MTEKRIIYEETFKDVKVTFKELVVNGSTLIDLMLSLKKNEPENYEKTRKEIELSIDRHLMETNQINKK